ncbi:MAG: NAD-dependent epimerase [Winogradskyella sp.]
MTNQTVLVTGAAGFIGFHLCEKLINQGYKVIGLDNINTYYDINLKYDRLAELGINKADAQHFFKLTESETYGEKLKFIRLNIEDRDALPKLFETQNIDVVCNLAAQAGVRYSIENPNSYIDGNIVGFLNVLECCRNHNIKRLVYASSSSIYGNRDKVPFKETDHVDNPISLYAATKKANELMAHTYSHLYNIETIGLRFFTVYGPWGRPDMALFLFTDAILNNKPIKVFNNGNLSRDFTYIDDIINGVFATLSDNFKHKSQSKYRIYNLGNGKPVRLIDFIECIENYTNKKAQKIMMPMQPGDVNQTFASTKNLQRDYGYEPKTEISFGIRKFVDWYKMYNTKQKS